MAKADSAGKARLRAEWEELFKIVHSEKLGEVADEFDHVHSVHRALRVGALRGIIPPATLRPYLVHAIERAMGKQEESEAEKLEVKPADEVSTAA